jgi:hypothetical protein
MTTDRLPVFSGFTTNVTTSTAQTPEGTSAHTDIATGDGPFIDSNSGRPSSRDRGHFLIADEGAGQVGCR